MKNFSLMSGQVIGQDHLFYHRNYQDAVATYRDNEMILAFIADGCSEGRYSEIGARFTVEILLYATRALIQLGISLEQIPKLLYAELLKRLRRYLHLYDQDNNNSDRSSFIRDHLLATVLGIALTPKNGIVLAAGDGIIAINDDVTIRDENNTPSYPAYHLISPQNLTRPISELPQTFTYQIFPTTQLRHLALATDGFKPELLPAVWQINNQLALQRQLNVWGFRQKKFGDDCTIVTLQKILTPEEVIENERSMEDQ